MKLFYTTFFYVYLLIFYSCNLLIFFIWSFLYFYCKFLIGKYYFVFCICFSLVLVVILNLDLFYFVSIFLYFSECWHSCCIFFFYDTMFLCVMTCMLYESSLSVFKHFISFWVGNGLALLVWVK